MTTIETKWIKAEIEKASKVIWMMRLINRNAIVVEGKNERLVWTTKLEFTSIYLFPKQRMRIKGL